MHVRDQLEAFLESCDGRSLQAEFSKSWIDKVIPGLHLLEGCDQGTSAHLEGDVAAHTALVFDNLVSLAPRRLDRSADFIERLSVVLHDWKKPQTRVPLPNGFVSFPDHEKLAAAEVPSISERLCLSEPEHYKLLFLVAEHGKAHSWRKLTLEEQNRIRSSPWIKSLALLQEADAISCILPGQTHLPVNWDLLVLS